MNTINLIATIDTIAQMSKRQKTYKERADPFLFPNDQFKARYRFNKSTVRKIIDIVKPDIELDKRGCGTSAKLQVLVALRCWGQREIQGDAAALHGLTQPTVSRICARVARALVRLGRNNIRMPQTLLEEQTIMRDFESIRNFPGVIGAIDDIHIKIQKKSEDMAKYYNNRDRYYSLNVQLVCDAKLLIRDVVARLLGSTHDSNIFNESTIKQRFENGEFEGRLVGDSGYELQPYLFTPLDSPRSDKELKYNTAQIATRNQVDRCVTAWKKRFRCLLDVLRINLENAKMLIVALAVIHNIAIQENDIVPDDHIDEKKTQNEVEENEISNNGNTHHPEDAAATVLKTFIQEYF